MRNKKVTAILVMMLITSGISLLVFSGCRKSSVTEIQVESLKVDSVYQWLCSMQQPNGLLLSSEGGKYVSLYDNALAALAFSAYGDFDKAEHIFDFFNERMGNELLVSPGGFGQLRTSNGIPVDNRPKRWLGDNAWLLIAMNNYHFLTGTNKYQDMANALTSWIVSLQDSDGGVWGGFNPDGSLISKVGEGNIDAFNAVSGYSSFHQKLLANLAQTRWDPAARVLIAWADNTKYKYALDLHAWSYSSLEGFPETVLSDASRFLTTQESTLFDTPVTGYCLDEDRDVVWLEGTGQMVNALIKAGRESDAQKYLQEMKKNLVASASFPGTYALPYTTNFGTSYSSDLLWDGVDINPAVSSTVWYLFGLLRFDPLALGYAKNIPEADRFWK